MKQLKLDLIMNKKLLFLSLISCALLASCTEEGTNDINNTTELPKQAQGKTITFKTEPFNVETKALFTKVDVTPDGNNDKLTWSETSEGVSFFFFDSMSNKFYDDATVATVWGGGAELNVTIPANKGNYGIYAISPAGDYFKDGSSSSILAIDQVQNQNGSDLSHLSPYIFLYSHPMAILEVDNEGNSEGNFPLSFDVLASLVRFDIVNTSNKMVKLNSIKIRFNNGGVLYKTATLNESNGTLSYSSSEIHNDMTLNLSNASLAANAGESNPYKAYMAVFPSGITGELYIDLDISVLGDDINLKYKLLDAAFIEKGRTHLSVVIESIDLPNADGTVTMTIGENEYKTYQFNSGEGGIPQLWMVEDSKEGEPQYTTPSPGYYYLRSMCHTACPGDGWRMPKHIEFMRLCAIVNSNNDLLNLFLQQPSSGSYLDGSYSSSFRAWNNAAEFNGTGYTRVMDNGTISWVSDSRNIYGFAVRCIKDL